MIKERGFIGHLLFYIWAGQAPGMDGPNRLIRVNLRRLNAFVPFFVQLFRDSMKIEDKFSEYA